jgi:F0F1-type ATP synthase epsilon subunit
MTLLGAGELSLRHGAQVTRLRVAGGFLQVTGDVVRIVTDQVSDIS